MLTDRTDADLDQRATARLGNTQTEFPPLPVIGSDRRLRRMRYARRQSSAAFLSSEVITTTGSLEASDLPRVARCGFTLGNTDVRVMISADGSRSTYAAVETCGSIWACPVCAAVIRARRADEITRAVENWKSPGRSVVFVTLTLRHRREDSLKTNLDILLKSFQRTLARRAWSNLRKDQNIVGFVRSVEITYGVNGWHPHIHALFFLDKVCTEGTIAKINGFYSDNWAKIVVSLGGRVPSEVHGYDVQAVDDGGQVLAKYLGKLQDEGKRKANVGAEIARMDIKTAVGSSSYLPFELLDTQSTMTDQQRYVLWTEYVTSTRRRRAITWSKGVREIVGLEDEIEDETIVEQDQESFSEVLFHIPAARYRALRRQPGMLTAILDMVELNNTQAAVHLSGGYWVEESL